MIKKLLILVCFILCASFSFGQIVQRGTAVTVGTVGTTLTINKPTGLTVGDVMLVQIGQVGYNSGTSAIGTDATGTGWVEIAGDPIRSVNKDYSRATLLYKTATSTDVAAANFSFAISPSSTAGIGTIIAFSGVDNSNPIDASASNYTTVGANNSQTLTANPITTTTANSAVIMFGAIHGNYTSNYSQLSNWTTTSSGTLTELSDIAVVSVVSANNSSEMMRLGTAWTTKSVAGTTGTGSATIAGGSNVYNRSIFVALRRSTPTITGLSSTSGCPGTSITISGTNLSAATAVRIGGTNVASITSNTATEIVVVVGSGTTGAVTVTNAGGTATSSNTFTVSPTPTTANAGPSQTLCGAGASGFTMAANTVGSGETGTWSTVSGNPQIISPSDPNSKVTVAPGTTAVLRWTISNSNCTSTSDVTLTNNASSTATPTGNSAQSFCASATVAELVATGTNIKWYSASSGGTPLATSTALINGNVYYASQTVGICESSGRFAVTVTVRAVPSVTIGGTATACQGELRNIRFTNNHTEAITVTYNINGGTNTTVNIAASTFADVLASTVSSGTFVYNLVSAVFQSGTSCPVTLSGSATVEIIETPEAPTIGTITNISCTVSSGSVVLSGLPSTGTWSIASTPVTTPRTGTGTSATISGLAMGDYTFVVTNEGGCPSSATGTVTISDASSTTWDGNEWSHGTPDATKNIIIDSVTPDSPFTADLVGCALTIKTGVVATVSSEVTLTITNAVTTNGQLIFEDKSSLIQINNVQNTGSISYKRITPPVRRYDFTYWSSPVFEPTLESVSPLTLIDKYHSYTGTGWFYENKINKMKTGKGYAIRAPQTYDITNAVAYPATFVGVPNNGDLDGESVAAGNYYLAGNPYPSAINIGKFLQDNSNVLEGTIEFWSHNQYPVFNVATGKYEYQSTDYLAYNTSGGIGTPGGTYPDAVITSGQSVLVKVRDNAPVGSKIIFNNDMRIGVGGKNNQFFKPGMADKTRMWLNFANDNGVFKQTLLGYFDEATNGYEDNYDAITSDQNAYADFYTINGEDHFTIQGKASFEDKDVVPLGYRAKMEGSYTIKAARIEGLLLSSDIYLEDKTLNKIHNLKEEPYTFTTKAGAFNERFIIKYTNKTLGIDDFEKTQNGVIVSIKEKVIKIESSLQNIKDVVVYDVSGKLLYQKNKVDGTLLAVEKLQSSNQVLLVKVILDNGYETTKKIIF